MTFHDGLVVSFDNENEKTITDKSDFKKFQIYSSRKSGDSPHLKIWWTLDDTSGYDSTNAFADSYIQSDLGDDNFGSSSELVTGWQDTAEKQTLVRFEIESKSYFLNTILFKLRFF